MLQHCVSEAIRATGEIEHETSTWAQETDLAGELRRFCGRHCDGGWPYVTDMTDLQEPGTLWIHSVPQEVVNSVSDTEKKRQEAINEVIYTERDFVRDMEYLRDVCALVPFPILTHQLPCRSG